MKPVCGLEKDLRSNLRSACLQDYPEYQVVLSVQDKKDPAVPLLEQIQREFPQKVSLVFSDRRHGFNGKVNNLAGALSQARHEILVISDSDVCLEADYLKTIVGPLRDRQVGFACTLYRAASAQRWYEKLELLTLNADFIPGVIFAYLTGASKFCLGSSVALRRGPLLQMGGFERLADYLAEDYELGRRIWESGKKMVLVPHWVKITVDLKGVSQWWNHQVGWDQKTRAASPGGFLGTILVRSIPFAFLFLLLRTGDPLGWAVLGLAAGVRLAAAAWILGGAFKDREGLKSLGLLPLRDLAGLIIWGAALTKKTTIWRDSKFTVAGGRLARRESPD